MLEIIETVYYDKHSKYWRPKLQLVGFVLDLGYHKTEEDAFYAIWKARHRLKV